MNHPPVLTGQLADGQKAASATRRTLMALVLSSALFLAMLMVVGVAWQQNQELVHLGGQLQRDAWQQQRQSLETHLGDCAFWHEAWLHMYLTIVPQWAWNQQNPGPGLFREHHYGGVFVTNVDDRTGYGIVDGELPRLGWGNPVAAAGGAGAPAAGQPACHQRKYHDWRYPGAGGRRTDHSWQNAA